PNLRRALAWRGRQRKNLRIFERLSPPLQRYQSGGAVGKFPVNAARVGATSRNHRRTKASHLQIVTPEYGPFLPRLRPAHLQALRCATLGRYWAARARAPKGLC